MTSELKSIRDRLKAIEHPPAAQPLVSSFTVIPTGRAEMSIGSSDADTAYRASDCEPWRSLIERLGKATGPDRVLGNDLLFVCGWTQNEYGLGPSRSLEWVNPDPNGIDYLDGDQPDPTASLDAARMLVSDFYWVASEGRTRDSEPLGGAQVFQKNYLTKPVAEAEHERVEIALCIAALKARAALPQDK